MYLSDINKSNPSSCFGVTNFLNGPPFVVADRVKACLCCALQTLQSFGQSLISSCASLYGKMFRDDRSHLLQGPLANLPDDLLGKLIELVGPQIGELNKHCASLNENVQELKWQKICLNASDDSWLASLVQEAESGTRFSTKLKYVFKEIEEAVRCFPDGPERLKKANSYAFGSLEKLDYLRNWLKDQNTVQLFKAIAKRIPEAEQYSATLGQEMELSHRAELLRAWMHQNQELVASLIGLNLQHDFSEPHESIFTEIPEEISLLSNLESLDMSRNVLKRLSPSLFNLKNLRSLYLKETKLKRISEHLGCLKKLSRLDLSLNQLSELPSSIGQLSGLVDLDLSYNQFTEIPDCIYQLKKLMCLSFMANRVEVLSDRISQMNSLQLLKLSHNKLSYLPENTIPRLRKLMLLDLKHNQLKEIPKKMGELRNLQKLNLSYNCITDQQTIRNIMAHMARERINMDGNPETLNKTIRNIFRRLFG